jgi:carbon storage regulator CsrA
MLVLTRKVDQELVIGDGPDKIIVRVIKLYGNRVKLAMTLPDDVKVLRGELVEVDNGTG